MVPQWIDNLKPGDRVAILSSGPGYRTRSIVRVEGRTGTGRVKAGGCVFNPDGSLRGQSDRFHDKALVELTPEVEAEIREGQERLRLVRILESTRWKDLPLDVLRSLETLLPAREAK